MRTYLVCRCTMYTKICLVHSFEPIYVSNIIAKTLGIMTIKNV